MSVGAPEQEQRQPDKRSERTVRRTLWVIGLFVGLPFIAFLMWSGLFGAAVSAIFPTVFYSEAFADITIDGKRHRLTSIAKCSLRAKARFGGLVGGAGSYKTVRGGLLLYKRPTGGGIVIVGPYLCSSWDREHVLDRAGRRTFDLEGFYSRQSGTPWFRVLELDDLENPNRITVYQRQYFERPGADFQIHEVGFREIESGTLADDTKRIPYLKGRKRYSNRSHCEQGPHRWVAYFTHAVPASEWSKDTSLKHLINSEKSQKIDPSYTIINRDIFPIEAININHKEKTLELFDDSIKKTGLYYLFKRGVPHDQFNKYIGSLKIRFGDDYLDYSVSKYYNANDNTIRLFSKRSFDKNRICR